MLIRSCFLLVFHIALAGAATTVVNTDSLMADQVWSDTIIVSKPLVIPERYTLTITPGSVVFFQPACSLRIIGNLMAAGTAADSIIFTASDTAAGWRGLMFDYRRMAGSSELRFICLQHVKASYSRAAVYAADYDGLKLSDSRIRQNGCGQNGGVVYIQNPGGPIERCHFTDNHLGSGGYVLRTSAYYVTNCSFVNNSTLGAAGVILQAGNSSKNSRITNCLFAGNIAATTAAGGCIHLNYGDIINCTIIDNSSSERCFWIRSGSVINSILWNNSPSNSIDTLRTVYKNNLIGIDPMLVDIAGGNYTPALRSPGLDLGTPDTTGLQLPPSDCAGQPRITCGNIDIGAFERPSSGNCPPRAIDTTASVSQLWSIPVIVDTTLFTVHDFDENPLHFIIDPGAGFTLHDDTLFIDSGRTTYIKTTVRATDGTDTTRAIWLFIYPQTAPEIRQVYEQSMRYFDRLPVTLKVVDAFDLDGRPQTVSIVTHAGENYTVEDTVIMPDSGFLGDLSVPVHATDGHYSSDTVILTVHVVPNFVPILSEVRPQQIPQWRSLTLGFFYLTCRDDDDNNLSIVLEPGDNYSLNGRTILPDSVFYGTLSIPVRITDGHDTSEALPLVLTVTKGNHIPVISAAAGGTYQDCGPITITTKDNVLAYDIDDDSLTLLVLPGPGYSVDGTAVTPDSCSGTFKVSVAVTDGIDTSKTVSIGIIIDTANGIGAVPATRPLLRYGKLRVRNGMLCSRDGYPVQLKGMSSHGLQWYGNFINQKCIEWLASDWHAGVIRAAMYTDEGGYLSDRRLELKRKVNEAAGYAKASGIYCIIDWHILYDNDPNTAKKEAIAFFTEMAGTYRNQEHVLYEICNEPNGEEVGWNSHVRPYAEEVIRAIRRFDSTGVILVGSSTWSQDVDSVALNPLPFDNIAYTFHFYAGTHGDTLKAKLRTALDSGLAVFVSEWGTSTSTGSGGTFLTESLEWLRLLDSANISWCNWSLCDLGESSAALKPKADSLGGWPDSVLSRSGEFVRGCIRADQINDPPVLQPVGDDTLHVGDSLTVRLQAFDPDLYQKLTWEATDVPVGMTVDDDGMIRWCADLLGPHSITVTVKDDSGSSASTGFSLFVDAQLAVVPQPEEFRFTGMAPAKGQLLFRFNPLEPTPYRLRVYSVDGRVVDDIAGVAVPKSAGGNAMDAMKARINTAGVYLVEFTRRDRDGKIRKTYTRITGVHF